MSVKDLSRRIDMKWIKPPVLLMSLAPLTNLAWKAFHQDLAATSTKGMIRRLGGKRRQMLHRLYVSAIAGAIHYYWLVKSDETVPLRFAAVVTILLAYRLLATFRGIVYRSS
jgi:hypothetical protein